jgi:dCTP deaminase
VILPDYMIRARLRADHPIAWIPAAREEFGQIEDSQIQPASLDVRLGAHFVNHVSGAEYRLTGNQRVRLAPGECILASLVERFSIPDDLVARVEGKSSWARRFLTVHSAGFIDPGFSGDITMELKNDGGLTLELYPGTIIAQVSFQTMAAPAERPYGSPGLGSHYQGQVDTTRARG